MKTKKPTRGSKAAKGRSELPRPAPREKAARRVVVPERRVIVPPTARVVFNEEGYVAPDFSRPFDLSCVDWEERIVTRSSLLPPGLLDKLDQIRSQKASLVFNKLRIPDVPGTPSFEEAGGEWFNELVRAVFGSWNGIERAINEFFLLVPKKNSKALALNTLIATPTGFTTMGSVRVGERVLAADGKRAKVIAKSVVFVGRPCYEVEFSTGERITCDAEHLWVTSAHMDREANPRDECWTVKTTEQIFETLKVRNAPNHNNHRTALSAALRLPQASLPMAPYVLGYWLGNGHSAGCRVSMDVHDSQHIVSQLVANGYPIAYARKDPRNNNFVVSLSDVGPGDTASTFVKQACELLVIDNKHIPKAYLRGSLDQRLELLRGLMDSDGSISVKGQATFGTTRKELRDGMMELVNSLGIKATTSTHRAKLNGKDCGDYWLVQFWPFDRFDVFTLPRKLKRQRKCKASNRSRSLNRQIIAVRRVKSVPTQCISIDNPTKQYLVTRSLVPTHNTTNAAGIMVTAMVRSERPRSEFLLVAPTQAVSSIAFAQALGMIENNPGLAEMCQIQDYKKKIVFLPTKCTLQIKSFDPQILTGIKPAGVLIDELHVVAEHHNADRVLGQIRGGIISQPEGFMIIITTQSERVPVGVFRSELLKARKIRDGEVKGVRMLPVLYEFPASYIKGDLWKKPENWDMVTPNNGRSITVARLVEEYQKAELAGDEEVKRWSSQHLNIEIGLALRSDHWQGAKAWMACGVEITLEKLIERCEVLTVGIDGGGLDDMLGLTVCGRESETGDWFTWSKAWVHPMTLDRKKQDLPVYKDFERDGDLVIVDMGQDMEQLGDIVEQVVKSDKLFKVGLDPSGIGGILDKLVEVGVKNGEGADEKQIVGISQGWRLNSAIKTTERKLAEKRLKHAVQPIMRWCVENAMIEPRGNAILITKSASGYAKIDPLMALFNAIELMSLNPPAAHKQFQMMILGG